jgi:thermostable 8-oxoguanine DNA glycosylase
MARSFDDIVRKLAHRPDVKSKLENLKAESKRKKKPYFIWDEILGSLSSWGNSRGGEEFNKNKKIKASVSWLALSKLISSEERTKRILKTLKSAKVRWAPKKSDYLIRNYDLIKKLGGPKRLSRKILNCTNKEEAILILRWFDGIGEKYARNLMMDICHPLFRNSVALDSRIKKISKRLKLKFKDYQSEENFYLSTAKKAGISGWELDRILYWFNEEILEEL